MDTDRVVCPHCGAENIKSPIITMCSSCMQSLEGAEPAPARPPEVTQEPEAPPAPAPEAVRPPPGEQPDFTPARSPELAPPEPPPTEAEPAEPPGPTDFRPPRVEVPPLEIPTLPSDEAAVGAAAREGEAEAEQAPAEVGPAARPLKVICPRCRGANPPEYRHCALCGTPLLGATWVPGTAETVRQTGSPAEWRPRPELMRGETAGQTKWGAACGCVVMAFIFFVLLALSTLR